MMISHMINNTLDMGLNHIDTFLSISSSSVGNMNELWVEDVWLVNTKEVERGIHGKLLFHPI